MLMRAAKAKNMYGEEINFSVSSNMVFDTLGNTLERKLVDLENYINSMVAYTATPATIINAPKDYPMTVGDSVEDRSVILMVPTDGTKTEGVLYSGYGPRRQAIPATDGNRVDVAYARGRFYVFSNGDSNQVVSTNLRFTEWRIMECPLLGIKCGAAGGGSIVAIAENSKLCARYDVATDNWTIVTLPIQAEWKDVNYGNGRFIAVAKDSPTAICSKDGGLTWEDFILPTSANWAKVYYENNTYFVLAEFGNILLHSTDTINWHELYLPNERVWKDMTYDMKSGLYVISAYSNNVTNVNGCDIVAYSNDGINWFESSIGEIGRWACVYPLRITRDNVTTSKFVSVDALTGNIAEFTFDRTPILQSLVDINSEVVYMMNTVREMIRAAGGVNP